MDNWLLAEAELTSLSALSTQLAESRASLGRLAAVSRRAERRLVTESDAADVLAASGSLAEAAPRLIRSVCESLGWDAGALWLMDRGSGLLRCAAAWHRPAAGALAFEAACADAAIAPGVALVGKVWEAGEPAWVSDAADRQPASVGGLCGAACFPVCDGERRLGALEFFGRGAGPPTRCSSG